MGNIKKGGNVDLKYNTKYLPEKYTDIYRDYLLKEGDAIIAMTDMSPSLDFLAVPAILPMLDGGVSYLLNQRVGKLLLEKGFDIRFVRYLLLSYELRGQLKAKGLGTVQANMSNDDLYSSYFFCPSFSERLKIANFLDHETAKIDTLIEKQQQLIKLLKEKRQAVISHAVTKGLNPDAPMKDSGVEWLGEVPEGWEITRIRLLAEYISYGFTNPMPTEDGGPFMLTAADIEATGINYQSARHTSMFAFNELLSAKSMPQEFDLLITKDGTLGRVALYAGEFPVCISQSIALVRPRIGTVNPVFLLFALSSERYQNKMIFDAGGTTIKHIYISVLSKMQFALPTMDVQENIVSFVVEKTNSIDRSVDAAVELSALLFERRTALISAAVTGKIDVRNWQPPKPTPTTSIDV